jgi:hypothetical protein
MIDSVMALVMVMVGVVGMLSLFPVSWNLSAIADDRSRAVSILYREIEQAEQLMMNPCNVITTPYASTQTAYSSGEDGGTVGDKSYTVNKTIEVAGTNIWLLTVTVSWGGGAHSITSAREVTRQDRYRYSLAKTGECDDNSNTGIVY